ncbi:hypothetical protein GQ43DRAFT_382227 [Delitschia confertaspora ATCC 74209]|uniref:Cyclin n=1 Tax=Delitschia confertaspora ATCC 74209 TaxID=1513339 RepID=A0A9P4JCT2_9PLEO|nr:hypothetical protein GQ43DRAFT_382227 [Delitschia confertaspora ATCC 74209]
MIEIYHPHPMPHAVPFDKPFDFYSSSSSSSRSSKKQHMGKDMQLPMPASTAISYLSVPRDQSRPPLTPPTEMAGQNANRLGPIYTQKGVDHNASYPYQLPAIGNSRAVPAQQDSSLQRAPVGSQDVGHRRKSSISPNLRVPPTIKTPQEGLPQLAAEITCLFWFENSSTLKQVLDPTAQHLPTPPLARDAIPTTGFKKWVATILATTQVAQNVILLALLFIYRLKQINPSVKGKPGSEYRLLTVALMLGNKFLDDNTYTNKTWAEVSGISVQEVHIMEVEFLSNMRYSLFTSKQKWDEWFGILGKFGTFFDKAAKATVAASISPTAPSLSSLQVPGLIPSPPQSQHTSPPTSMSYSPAGAPFNSTPMFLPQASSTSVSPTGTLPELGSITQRKRSADYSVEPPAKRPAHGYASGPPGPGPYSNSMAIPTLQAPASRSFDNSQSMNRLPPLPSLSIPPPQYKSAPVQMDSWPELPYPTPSTGPPPNSHTPSTVLPTSRAMAIVYPPSVNWSASFTTPTNTTAPSFSSTYTPTAGTNSRHGSPYMVSANASPASATYRTNQPQLSPSYFLSQRQSPYRPVRGVHTLLVPPPSTSMHNPASQIRNDQMQYQPLGKSTNERRIGTLPYMNYDGLYSNNFNQLPPPPQPNFHR